MRMDIKTIKAGTYLQKISSAGQILGWHEFSQDSTYKAEYRQRIYQTVLVVKSGPDKGTYRAQ